MRGWPFILIALTVGACSRPLIILDVDSHGPGAPLLCEQC